MKLKHLLTFCLAFVPLFTFADIWPSKPVKIIVPYQSGGDIDLLVRKIEKKLEIELHQPITVEYKPGASSNIGAMELANSNPDGYTWMIGLDAILTVNPVLLPSIYNTKDIRPVSLLTTRSNMLVCRSDIGATNVKDFLELSKTKSFNYGFGGLGTPSHLLIEALKDFYNLDITGIPYKSIAPVIQALASKEIDCSFITAGPALGLIEAKNIIPIAYAGYARSPMLPNIPTFNEIGYKGVSGNIYNVLYTNVNTPDVIVNRMVEVFSKVMKSSEIDFKNMDHIVLVTDPFETQQRLNKLTKEQSVILKKVKITGGS